MKLSIFIEPEREEEILIYAHEKTRMIEQIEELISDNKNVIMGYGDGKIVKLSPIDVICFTVEDSKIYGITKCGKFHVKMRLYQLEERFSEDFLKINQSCLVRVDKIRRFQTSIGGSLTVVLEGGYHDYISRRQLKTVKERMGLTK